MNGVGFVISEREDLTLGQGPGSRALVQQSFIKVCKGTENTSDIDIRRGTESAPLASLSKGAIYFFN